tara:strand:- start:1585 stop:3915 length:2331 start_codon:yes stop_codon:yes gene_type:complete
MSKLSALPSEGTDFIRQQIRADLASGRYGDRVVTRFPPEPNGYLHVGHATAICLNFGIAEEFNGRCHLRFDDTNPDKENEEFARSIKEDVRWLGFDWGEHLYYASDYFERMYDAAVGLIERGLAYVDSESLEAIRKGRGTVTEPGVPSPYRGRSVAENLDLFERMRAGEFSDGEHVLRGKIDMSHTNMLMRDPVLYRIRHARHYRRGDEWCIYPLYDYAHCLEDAFENVTHSICTIEFENNRELYDWVLENTGFQEPRPHQYEWAGLNLENAVLSKRSIAPLVVAGVVSGWDDPRLATISAYRRRGVPPEAIRMFARLVGVSRSGGRTEADKFDHAIREVLNFECPRVMAVLDPIRVVLTNLPEGHEESFEIQSFPDDVGREGFRTVPFGREVWIERSDFSEDPPRGFRRLVLGGEVRLRGAYVIRCEEVVKDDKGVLTELRCTVDAATRGGGSPDGRKVRGTIQWVAIDSALDAEVRLFSELLKPLDQDPEEDKELIERVNPDSLVVASEAKLEPSIGSDSPETRYQFERAGYFWRDPVDGLGERLVFNRIVGLKSTFSTKSDRRRARARALEEKTSGPSVRPQISAARQTAREEDPRLEERFIRYQSSYGLSTESADLLTGSIQTALFFEAAMDANDDATSIASWMVTEVRGLSEDGDLSKVGFTGEALGRLVELVGDGTVSRRAAKDVLLRMNESGGEPDALVREMGLETVSDTEALGMIIEEVLSLHPEEAEEYREGKGKLIGLFIGEVMKATRGAADPKVVEGLLRERLGS